MRNSLLVLMVGLLIVAAGVVVAQETALNPLYTGRASAVDEKDLPGRVELAKWAFKNGMFAETLAECRNIRSLSEGDLRAGYLARAAQYYSGTDIGRFEADDEQTVTTTNANGNETTTTTTTAAQANPANVISLSDEEVTELFAKYGNKGLNEYRTSLNAVLVRTCGRSDCHGNVETAGRLYLKAGATQKIIAENFTALDQFIDHRGELAQSRLLKVAAADKPVHPGGQVLREDSPVYTRLSRWVKGLWVESAFD